MPTSTTRWKDGRFGRFTLDVPLGEGGFGEVWSARDPLRPGERLALKIARSSSGAVGAGRASREFRLGARVRHPVLVELLESGVAEGREYLLAERIDGRHLEPPWPRDGLEAVTVDLLGALEAVHAAGLVHGDIQPGNLIVEGASPPGPRPTSSGASPRARLLDFGLARERGYEGAKRTGGHPLFLSPEALLGETPDERADLYSLGLVLFQCLVRSISSPLAEHLEYALAGGYRDEASQVDLPWKFGSLLPRLLEPQPRARLQSASEALELVSGERDGRRTTVPSFESSSTIGVGEYSESLRRALTSVAGGGAKLRTLVVTAERGGGKTRCIRDASLSAVALGVRSMEWPLALRAAENRARERESGSAGSGEELAVAPGSRRDERLRLLDALEEVLAEQPTALLVDDADRLTGDEVALLSALVSDRQRARREGARAPLVLVVTQELEGSARPEVLGLLALLRESYSTSEHRLRPWGEVELSLYLDEVLPPRRELGEFERAFRERTGGNPGLARALLREVARRGELVRRTGAWRVALEALATLEPPGERRLFDEAWIALSPPARAIATAAVLAFDPKTSPSDEDWASTCGLDRPGVRAARREIDASDLLRSGGTLDSALRNLASGRRLRVRIGRAAGPVERVRLRRIVARWSGASPRERLYQRLRFESVDFASIRTLATNGDAVDLRLFKAHATSRADAADRARSARFAAELAMRRGQFAAAAVCARLAVLSSPTNGHDHDRVRDRLLLAEALAFAGRTGDARAAFELAARGATGELAARVAYGRAVFAYRINEFRNAVAFCAEAVRGDGVVPAYRSLSGTLALASGDRRRAADEFRRAFALATDRGDLRASAATAVNAARLYLREGRSGVAERLLARATRAFSRAGEFAEAARARGNLGVVYRRREKIDAAFTALESAADDHRRAGDAESLAASLASLSALAREIGLAGTASRYAQAARRAASRAGAAAESRLARSPEWAIHSALLALDLGGEAGTSDSPSGEASRAREGADALLLRVRSRSVDDLAADERLARRAGDEALDPGDAVWILAALERARANECARAGDKETGSAARLSALAITGLERLARKSRVARVGLLTERIERSSPGETDPNDRRDLAAALDGLAHRGVRARALAVLVRRSDESERRTFLKQLRSLVDEWTLDVSASDRPSFFGRTDIAEIVSMIEPTQTSDSIESDRSTGEVLRFTREILATDDVRRVLREIVDAASGLTGAELGALVVRGGGGFEIAAAREHGEDIEEPESRISTTIVDRTLRDGRPRLTTDAAEDITLRSITSVEELGLRSVLCVPVRAREGGGGAVLYLDNSVERGVFTASQLALVESFCVVGALAWRSAEERREREELVGELTRVRATLESELGSARRQVREADRREAVEFDGIVGASAAMRRVLRWIETIAPSDLPVLISGPSGAGKELVARAVYRHSRRRDRPFVAENFGAIPAGLIESVLFGHRRGAFSGADRDQRGLFELASGGTLFLDEIGELPLELQSRLLRALEEGEVRPLGSESAIRVDVRIIAATNRDLRAAVADGRFREDLYFRLQGAEVRVPPLSERREDVAPLVAHFLARETESGAPARRFSAEALERLERHRWPGNVRELQHEVRRACLLAESRVIGVDDLSDSVREGRGLDGGASEHESAGGSGAFLSLKEIEKRAILDALARFEGHRGKAAAALGVARSTLYLKLKSYGVAD